MKIARVFPTKTSMSPTDPLAFFGPPTLDAIAAEPDEVHISVTFSWDLEKADELLCKGHSHNLLPRMRALETVWEQGCPQAWRPIGTVWRVRDLQRRAFRKRFLQLRENTGGRRISYTKEGVSGC